MDFEIGDKVVCVNPLIGLTKGEIYTVGGIREGTPDIWLEGVTRSWMASRFRLVTPLVAEASYLELFQ